MPQPLTIALLHIAPQPGARAHNQQVVAAAIAQAAALGADWVVTPELCLTGYRFTPSIGTGWIAPQPDAWLRALCVRIAALKVTVFLACTERDPTTGAAHNTAIAIGPGGEIVGRHRKILVVPGAESWSSPGGPPAPIDTHPLRAGVLICADAWPATHAAALAAQGAQILISPAAWGPRPHGPGSAWRDRSAQTGLPLLVCNRTGAEPTFDFSDAQSGVFVDGQERLAYASAQPAIVLVDWDHRRRTVRHTIHPLSQTRP